MAPRRAAETDAGRPFCRPNWLLFVIILSLGAGLATRYVYASSIETVTTVKAASPNDHHYRQRLYKNALQWSAPVEELTVFVSAIGFHHPVPIESLLVVHLDDSLYIRPPPSC